MTRSFSSSERLLTTLGATLLLADDILLPQLPVKVQVAVIGVVLQAVAALAPLLVRPAQDEILYIHGCHFW